MTSDLLSLASAAAYCGRQGSNAALTRWARRHLLPHVAQYQIPNSGIVFHRKDLGTYLERFRVEPALPPRVDLNALLSGLDRAPRRRRAGGAG